MTTFIIICVVMTLIAVLAVVLPLWFGGRVNPDADRRSQVLAILRQQAADLEADRAAGRIDEDEFEESRMELERRVLEETRQEDQARSGKSTLVARILAVIFLIVIPTASSLAYLALGRYTAMDPQFIAMMEEQSARQRGHSGIEMQRMLDKLRADLEKDPMNANGWFMLARTAAQMNRFDESVEAFKKLNALVPNNADIIADMADMMAAANGKVITPDIEALLKKALRLDPNQWKALALLAIQAWDRQQYVNAALYWQKLLQVVPPDFPDRDQIESNIAEAKRLGGVNDSISAVSPKAADQNAADASAAAEDAAAAAKTAPVPTASPADMKSVAGTVIISDELRAKTKPDDVVFIYARPAEGSRMPVAFMKVTVKDLPYNFTLDSTTTMGMGMTQTLENVKAVIVGARISKTGNFMPQAGDLEGEMPNPVEVGDRGLVVQISTVHQ